MDVNDLIEDIKKGKSDALDDLVDEYGKLIYGVIASIMLPNNMDSEIDECFNDVLITIWFKIESFDLNKGKFRNWIISLSKYKALDYLRKRKRDEELNEEHISDEASIEEEMLSNEEKDFIKKSINSLESIDRDIFTLRFIEDLSIEEISEKLNIDKGTLYTRISRGKKKLKKLMEGYYE